MAAALTLAIMLATLAALRQDVTDGTIRRTQELEALTMVPVMGVLPRLEPYGAHPAGSRYAKLTQDLVGKKLLGKIAALIGAADPVPESEDPEESAGALYSRLVLAGAGKALRSILICSATPGEGKTFTTMALAKCAAENGRRVLVIDWDIAPGALAGSLAYLPRPGWPRSFGGN